MSASGITYKIFNDAVHGHIRIPTIWCDRIIDTPQFQRLRRIEQSFVSTLYPSATHNRFTHSIGVYHVGMMIFNGLEQNSYHFSDIRVEFEKKTVWKYSSFSTNRESNLTFYSVLKDSFLVACLLHDCGHSPFSHTFEEYYIHGKNRQNILTDMQRCANAIVSKQRVATSFMQAVADKLDKYKINPHELVSAWLVLHEKGFLSKIMNEYIHADPLLVARMITGTKFEDVCGRDARILSLLNCYIGLLNGNAVDADRIDYSLRDQWATGNASSVFNVRRLIDSISIEEIDDKFIVSYNKRCLSELHFIHEIKNRNSFWVFSHHKFKLLENSIKNAVTQLALVMSVGVETGQSGKKLCLNRSEPDALAALFDYKTLICKKEYDFYVGGCQPSNHHRESLIYTSDDDIIHLLKKYFSVINDSDALYVEHLHQGQRMFHEWLSRHSLYLPLWKSYYEYREICYNYIEKKLKDLDDEMAKTKSPHKKSYELDSQCVACQHDIDDYIEIIKRAVKRAFKGAEPRIIPTDFKVSSIKEDDVMIKMHGELIPYEELAIPMQNTDLSADEFFYCFIRIEDAEKFCKPDENDLYTKCALHLKNSIKTLTVRMISEWLPESS